jgi:acyl-CoA thioesterase-1
MAYRSMRVVLPARNLCLAIVLGLIVATAPFLAGAQSQRRLLVVAFGDSLTAGFGLPAAAAFPVVLQAALKARGLDVEIANAGVSGDTTSGGLERLDWSVPPEARAVILELGANDALRGIDPAIAERNLEAIVAKLKQRGVAVFLAGMRAPPNMGPEFRERFDGIYPRLAQRHGLMLYPFFLDGVAGEARLNQADGIHPTAEGVRLIVERMLPDMERFIRAINR